MYVCLFSQLMSTPRFRDRQPYVHFECERHVYVVRSHISGYGLFGKNNIRRNPTYSHSIQTVTSMFVFGEIGPTCRNTG